jgi:hypothetical protein
LEGMGGGKILGMLWENKKRQVVERNHHLPQKEAEAMILRSINTNMLFRHS